MFGDLWRTVSVGLALALLASCVGSAYLYWSMDKAVDHALADKRAAEARLDALKLKAAEVERLAQGVLKEMQDAEARRREESEAQAAVFEQWNRRMERGLSAVLADRGGLRDQLAAYAAGRLEPGGADSLAACTQRAARLADRVDAGVQLLVDLARRFGDCAKDEGRLRAEWPRGFYAAEPQQPSVTSPP